MAGSFLIPGSFFAVPSFLVAGALFVVVAFLLVMTSSIAGNATAGWAFFAFDAGVEVPFMLDAVPFFAAGTLAPAFMV